MDVKMQSKTLFEKLLFPGEDISVMDSVCRNINMLLNSDRLLDGDKVFPEITLVPAIIDQVADSPVDLNSYKTQVAELLIRHEPRISALEIDELRYTGAGQGFCSMRLTVNKIESRQSYYF